MEAEEKTLAFGSIELRYADLTSGFATSFTKLFETRELDAKKKMQIVRLQVVLNEKFQELQERRKALTLLGDAITQEQKDEFSDFANSTFTVPFQKIDVMQIINHISGKDIECLKPILKGL